MDRRLLRISILLTVAILLCGCEKAALNPQIPYGLLIKSRDFLSFCIFLANQEKPYYNQIAQRYYYAVLTLASITYQWNKGHGLVYKVVKHDDVWKLMPCDVKKTYGEELKGLRVRCDYYYEEQARNMRSFKEGIVQIIGKEKVFPQLEQKVRIDCMKFFDGNESIVAQECDILMDDIKELHETFKLLISNDIHQ